ncbi:MAG: response regulator, partial [Pseudomonadales bacterium]|nr:response regulator [Pseudomonadales bacterium]
LVNDENYKHQDLALFCFKKESTTSIKLKENGIIVKSDLLVGSTDIAEIISRPIFHDKQCIGVFITAHLSISKPSEERIIDECLVRVSAKMHNLHTSQERERLSNSLTLRASELEKLNEENIRVSKIKSEFLACMSHEIRTPMNGVIGMLSLIAKTELNKKQSYYAELASDSANSLLLLINDILDFSKVESNQLQIESIDFDIRYQIGVIVKGLSLTAQNKNTKIILDLTDVSNSTVKGDPGRLRQIITNLVSNAIKFTQQGEILIVASLKNTADHKLEFECSVSDTGIGIPSDRFATLFQSFTQADSSTTRQYGGTGLGLAIVSQLCELMGGEVDVSSVEGEGSTFTFSLMLESSDKSIAVKPTIDMRGLSIVIIDENDKIRQTLKRQFEHWGADVYEEKDGRQAMDGLKNHYARTERAFDIAFINMHSPEINGLTLASRIHSNAHYSAMKMILMVEQTETVNESDLLDAGISFYFHNPATTVDLIQALSIVEIGKEVKSASLPVASCDLTLHKEPPTDNETFHILVVDDTEINRIITSNLLADVGLTYETANNGIEALERLRSTKESRPYNLVLMDCQMPKMDGYEATREIRKENSGRLDKFIPIIAMTANAMKGDREKCLAAGMDDYLSKPIDVEKFEEKIQYWLSISTVNTPPPIADNDSKSEGSNRTGDINNNSLIWDRESACQRVSNKEERLLYLLNHFLNDIPIQTEVLHQAIKDENMENIRFVAHQIKGIAANLGGMQLQESAHVLENSARSNKKELCKKNYLSLYENITIFSDTIKKYVDNSE